MTSLELSEYISTFEKENKLGFKFNEKNSNR